MLSDFLKNLMQGNNNGGNAESISRNVKDLLGEGFEDYLQYRMMKDALKRTPKGGPVVVDGPNKPSKKYTTPRTDRGPQIKAPKSRFYIPPSPTKRLLTTIKNSKIAPGRLGLVGAGLIGLNEYAESGDVSRAVAKGAVQGAGTYAGAAAGAAAGALIGSIGGPLGAGIGAIVGGIGGGILGGSLSEKPADLAADFVSNPVKTTKDAFAKIKAKLEPMAQDTQAKLISDLTGQNQDYMTNANVPNIVIPSINQSTPAKQENNYLLPQAPARNTESTLEKFLNRNYF